VFHSISVYNIMNDKKLLRGENMRDVSLINIFEHRIAKKFLTRSGLAHAIAVSYHAFHLAKQYHLDVDTAAKAGLLHDMGHYTWYKNGKWDYELYKQNDIHAIKGAERAHKLLIRLGENPIKAKTIALAILFHTDSFLPSNDIVRTPLQQIVKWADEKDEEKGGMHHYRAIELERAKKSIIRLDEWIDIEEDCLRGYV
jgi:uncharacterized protein